MIIKQESPKPFCLFVAQTIQVVCDSYGLSKSPLSCFAEGTTKPEQACTEYAILRGHQAHLFLDTVKTYSDLLGISEAQIKQANKYNPVTKTKQLKVIHSCYPKNLRRWQTGTVARKRINRAEFCVLLWCWSSCNEWLHVDVDHKELQRRLLDVMRQFVDADLCEFSFEGVWSSCEAAYHRSY